MDENGGGFSFTGLIFGPGAIVLQVLALLHAVKRRPEGYWYLIILMGGGVGALVYIVAEIVPDFRLVGNAFAGTFARKNRQSRIVQLEAAIIDNPSPANYEELGDLYLEEKLHSKAREAFDRSISSDRAGSLHNYYYRAKCSMGLRDWDRAIEDLERVLAKDQKYDYNLAALLLANAYGYAGKADAADAWFKEATHWLTSPEALFQYAWFLKQQGRREEAREWAQKVLDKKHTLPRYMQRIERPWFHRAKAMIKELAKAGAATAS